MASDTEGGRNRRSSSTHRFNCRLGSAGGWPSTMTSNSCVYNARAEAMMIHSRACSLKSAQFSH